jgi:ATP-dependent DNA helicase RecG
LEKNLNPGFRYRVFGKIGFYNGEAQLTHPEMEGFDELKGDSSPLQPVYPSTEKLKARSLGGRQIAKLTRQLLSQLREKDIPEFIPEEIRRKTGLISRFQAEQSNTWKQQKRDALPVEIEEFFSTS